MPRLPHPTEGCPDRPIDLGRAWARALHYPSVALLERRRRQAEIGRDALASERRLLEVFREADGLQGGADGCARAADGRAGGPPDAR